MFCGVGVTALNLVGKLTSRDHLKAYSHSAILLRFHLLYYVTNMSELKLCMLHAKLLLELVSMWDMKHCFYLSKEDGNVTSEMLLC